MRMSSEQCGALRERAPGRGREAAYLEPVHDDDLAVAPDSDLVARFDPPSIFEYR